MSLFTLSVSFVLGGFHVRSWSSSTTSVSSLIKIKTDIVNREFHLQRISTFVLLLVVLDT